MSASSEAVAPPGPQSPGLTSHTAEVRTSRTTATSPSAIAPSFAPSLRSNPAPGGDPQRLPRMEDSYGDLAVTTVYSQPSRPAAPAAPIDASPSIPITSIGPVSNVNLTFYDCASQGFCGHMYNGEWVYEGAAACSWNLAIGTAFTIEGDPTERVYVCKDRGLLSDTWVDIFWYHPADGYYWQSFVGRYGTINVVYVP